MKINKSNPLNQLFLTSKSFRYGRYLITMFPFFAILIQNHFINSLYDVSFILPFVPVFAAGFMYNTFCDASKDPGEKNPITQGSISEKFVLTAILLSLLISIFIFILVYSSKPAIFFFLIYILLWLGYSGLKIRFKESVLGPIVASLVLFIGPSIILLIEFNQFDYGTILLVLGLFIIYIGHEIKHTIIEYKLDKSFDCKTFAVITGKKNANLLEYISLIFGYILLLYCINYFIPNVYPVTFFTILFGISIFSTITYGIMKNYDQDKDLIFNKLPYISTRIYIIILGFLVLNTPLLIIFFVIWILFTDSYL